MSKHILVFGAGKSATTLIAYLQTEVTKRNWFLTVADASELLLQKKVQTSAFVNAVCLNINNDEIRKQCIENADIVISLLPPHLHILVAKDCLQFSKHLLTASYIDNDIKAFETEINNKKLIFLYEMGLDPGIDHMSAMKMIDEIHAKGGRVTSFKSHCGGLVAPSSDDNPWHYKISWNPKNVVLAGKAGAEFKWNNIIQKIEYKDLFNQDNILVTPNNITYGYYANRDSLSYMPKYKLQHAHTFLRTTLRHPSFIAGWKNIIALNLTNESELYDTTNMTIAAFFKLHFQKNGFSDWLEKLMHQNLQQVHTIMQETLLAHQMNEEDDFENEKLLVDETGNLKTVNLNNSAAFVANTLQTVNETLKQLFYLGLTDDETFINKGTISVADILTFILEEKLKLEANDKDLVVMLHEIEYELKQKKYLTTSFLYKEGTNNLHTAMAQTVGLPLAIAAILMAEGVITNTGLQIPTTPHIYNPVLEQLAKNKICFEEQTNLLTE
jgi:saccharopine dehydrogenase-like NADP-dependent oxidoreductase